ncbi:MAG: methylmalonyl Co-A mutase-associated GTPase MeaB [Halioglobus sp.]
MAKRPSEAILMDVAAELLAGKVLAGARAIRWLDDRDPRGEQVMADVFAATGNAQVVGVTGPPGAGKSTLVDALVTEQRKRGRRVGVIAVDPSSPFTGGAILGDRVRMSTHTLDEGVFIRSLGTRGQGGGLSRSAHDACLILDAMGYDVIFVETVGVGQDEIDIVALAHTTLIVAVPGMGDEVQVIKAGLMEVGDLFVVNKADREGADATLAQLEMMLHLRQESASGAAQWSPPALKAVASQGQGTADVVDVLDQHAKTLRASGEFAKRTSRRATEQVLLLVREALLREANERLGAELLEAVDRRELDPYAAARALLERRE